LTNHSVNGRANVSQAISNLQGINARPKAVSSDLNELLCRFADLPYGNGSRRISYVTLVGGTGIDLYDVALLQDPIFGRDPVDDLIVNTDTSACRKAGVPKERGDRTALFDISANRFVDLIGADAGTDHITGDGNASPVIRPASFIAVICAEFFR
jgi:hypothetical protein